MSWCDRVIPQERVNEIAEEAKENYSEERIQELDEKIAKLEKQVAELRMLRHFAGWYEILKLEWLKDVEVFRFESKDYYEHNQMMHNPYSERPFERYYALYFNSDSKLLKNGHLPCDLERKDENLISISLGDCKSQCSITKDDPLIENYVLSFIDPNRLASFIAEHNLKVYQTPKEVDHTDDNLNEVLKNHSI